MYYRGTYWLYGRIRSSNYYLSSRNLSSSSSICCVRKDEWTITTPAPTKKTNKIKKSERKLQTTLLEDNYDVNENKEYASLKEQVDELEKTVAVLLGRLDELQQ